MADPERIAVTRVIDAPAADIFRVIADPHGHVLIDGSGMLVAAPGSRPLTRVGDSFDMDMDREPLGDVPLGKYRVVNAVTRFVPNEQLEWSVAWPGSPPFGHVYGYLLASADQRSTKVCSYCDWSDLSQDWRGHISFPVISASMLEKSLENLARIAQGEDPEYA
jgi:uncharacterized protein YndB with AHSA1/START domain